MRLLSILVLLLFSSAASAEVFSYQDQNGVIHFVDSEEKIPEKYREQVKGETKLPPISKTKSPKYKKGRSPGGGGHANTSSSGVTVLVTSWCGYCRKLEAFLNEKRIRYKRLDVERNRKGKRMYSELGRGGVPITKIGSQVVRGYQPDEILRILGKS